MIIWRMMTYVGDRGIRNVWWLKEYMMTYMVNREYVDDRGIWMYDDIQVEMTNHRSVWWHIWLKEIKNAWWLIRIIEI